MGRQVMVSAVCLNMTVAFHLRDFSGGLKDKDLNMKKEAYTNAKNTYKLAEL